MSSYLHTFMRKLRSFRNEAELHEFLKGILTPAELDEIPKRLQIVQMLKAGVAQREIAEKLGVGVATVTRGSRVMSDKDFENLI